MRLLLGGYGPDMGGIAEGIGLLEAGDPDSPLAGGVLSQRGTVVRADSPSWIARHPTRDVVYAALEGSGRVAAFERIDTARFRALGTDRVAGDSVCHLAVAADGGSLVASCYGDGRVVRIPLDDTGRLEEPSVGQAASDPYGPDAAEGRADADVMAGAADLSAAARALRDVVGPEYAELVPYADDEDSAPLTDESAEGLARRSHAHAAVHLPDGRIATTDLGFDVVRIWRPSPSGLRQDHDVVLPRGSGPRHLVVHPSGHLFVVSEFSCEVFVLAADQTGRWHLRSGVPTGALPGDAAAELAAGLDGEFLYAGLRGSNTISVLRVRGAGDELVPLALVESGVNWPRHHVIVRDELIVAGERSNEVVSSSLDIRTGVPGRVRRRVEAPTPTRVLPLR